MAAFLPTPITAPAFAGQSVLLQESRTVIPWAVRAGVLADGTLRAGAATYGQPQVPVQSGPGVRMRTSFDDWYYRLHVQPLQLALGSVVTRQQRTVEVWNAFFEPIALAEARLDDAAGVDLSGPPAPRTVLPLELLRYTLTIGTDGPPVIAGTLTFRFTGLDDVVVQISGIRLQAWPITADWGSAVTESLEWLTDVQQSINGNEDAEPKRAAPRRSWEFDVLEGRRERRFVENAVYDWAARVWMLPVMADVSLLPAALPAGETALPVDPAGLDFRAGGLALLWRDVQTYELVEIAALEAGGITLSRGLARDWPRGTRLYPCRTARLTDAPVWRRRSDQVIAARVSFMADEPCDWPAQAPLELYRGFPVLNSHPDTGEDPTAQSQRVLVTTDGDTGLLDVQDLSGLAWQGQSHKWVLHGRDERAAHRGLLYWLQGRAGRVWLPSFADDVELAGPVIAATSTLTVVNGGISRLRGQPGRRHLRIELRDGTVYFRAVVSASELDANREALQLDAAIPRAVTPGQVRVISWMMLARQSTDRVEVSHVTDSAGVATCKTGFVFVGREEPAAA